MKIPKRLVPLIEDGLIDEVMRQLMSGKEAMVFVVRCGDDVRCAKVYKEADKRAFRQAVDYTENRRTKNSRMARAMAKGTRFGREAQEAAWQNAEVDALYEAIGRVLREAIAEIRKRNEPPEVKVRDFLKVRGRDGKPCLVCGTTIRAVRVGDGDACFCPQCQPETRKLFVSWSNLNRAPGAKGEEK